MLPIIIILDLIAGLLISIFAFNLNIGFEILIGVGFGVGLLLIEGMIFFLIVIIFSLPIKKDRRYKYSKFYESFFRAYERFGLRLFNVKVKVINKELIPNDNFIIISNHRSNLDSFVIDTVLKKDKLLFAAKKSLFSIPWFGHIIWRNNYLYLTRTDAIADVKEVYYGIDLVNKENYSIGIFPEGKRNFENDSILPFMKGYQLLLNKTHKPLVITSLKGTHEVNNHLFTKRHKVIFEVIEVLDYEKYSSFSKDELDNYIMDLLKNNLAKK